MKRIIGNPRTIVVCWISIGLVSCPPRGWVRESSTHTVEFMELNDEKILL
jgi:hypothetical protein